MASLQHENQYQQLKDIPTKEQARLSQLKIKK
jgi:hypothetical protein